MFGQMPNFEDGLALMQSFWRNLPGAAAMPGASMPIPGLSGLMPTMDLEALDKQITDMKAVESWLTLNMNMLRTAIQGLEVQRATLVALQTFGVVAPKAAQAAATAPWPAPAAEPAASGAAARSAGDAAEAKASDDAAETDDPPAQPASTRRGKRAAPKADGSAGGASGTAGAASGANPAAAWWDLLQGQFEQIAKVSGAQAGAMPVAGTAKARKTGAGGTRSRGKAK